MNFNKIPALFIALFVLNGSAAGQTGRTLLHIDKEFYATGEVVWYSLHLPSFFSQLDKVIRVTVADSEGRIASQYHLRTGGETAVEGYYKIPFDAETDVYRIFIHAVSRYIGQDPLLAEVKIPVFNDFDRVKSSLQENEQVESDMPKDLKVVVKVAGDDLEGERLVGLSVTDPDGSPVEANVSISIADAGLCHSGKIIQGESIDYLEASAMQSKMVLRGVLYDKDGAPLQVNVLGAYFPEVQRVVYSKSDDDGNFYVELPDFYGNRTVQYLGYSVEVESFDVKCPAVFEPGSIDDEVVYTQEVIEYLELSRKRKKIYQYFTTLEHNLDIPVVKPDVQELKPDFRYKIEEYEDFDFMRDFFDELITPLKFIKENDSTYRARLENPKGRNRSETNLTGAPLFIVDGIATRNADFVARLDLGLVKYVDLYYDPYKLRSTFNAVGRSGVIIVTTRLPDLEFPEEEFEDIFPAYGLQMEVPFPTPPSDSRIPAIAPQLYWNGNVSTDANGNAQIRISKSDDLATYRVQVVAQSKDGRRGTGRAEYSSGR